MQLAVPGGQRSNLTAVRRAQATAATHTPTPDVLPAPPFLPIGPPHRVPRRVWDPQLSCHRVTVTCHLTCGLGGRARRRRAIPEPRQRPGPLDPHNAAHPRGRMSPRLGLPPPRQPCSQPACHHPPRRCSSVPSSTRGPTGSLFSTRRVSFQSGPLLSRRKPHGAGTAARLVHLQSRS